jgi:hypothetical protein
MKKHILISLLVATALSACATEMPNTQPNVSTNQVQSDSFRLASDHWANVAKLQAEANRLGDQVRAGKLTKVQAAQYLNRLRISLVGNNIVDDSVYEVYQRAAVDSQRGTINSEQSKVYVKNALRGWQQRWPHMKNKPNNPAFTNFLLEFMGMQPLQ